MSAPQAAAHSCWRVAARSRACAAPARRAPAAQGGNTPLHRAAADGRESIARILLDRGADISATDNVRCAARAPRPWLCCSLHRCRSRAALTLASARPPPALVLRAGAQNGEAPLLHAVRSGNEALVALLLDRGADLEKKDAVRRAAPLPCT